MATIGQVDEITREFQFEWRINDFFKLSGENRKCYHSPSFLFVGVSWYLRIHPDGSTKESVGYISLFLSKRSSDPPINLACSFDLKTFDEKTVGEERYTHVFDKKEDGFGYHKFFKLSELLEKKSEWVPSDILTVVCTLYYSESTGNADYTDIGLCRYCKKPFEREYVTSHEEKCLKKPIRCPTCNDVIELSEWLHHECQLARVKANEKLVDDFSDILNNEDHSDVTIKVKDEEFRLHRSILAGRNPFFRSMFNNEMKENTSGIVSIDDCEPNLFKSFINFLYTGKTQTLSTDNVCALYEVADKYQEEQLKAECSSFMKNKISVDTFCDFVVLSLKHDDKELLRSATELFCRETKEIIKSVKWRTFLTEHPTQGNELYIKAFECKAN